MGVSRVGHKQGKRWLVATGIAVSAVCGYLAFRGTSWEDSYHALAGVHLVKLIVAFLFLAASISLSARRWQLLVGHHQARWSAVLAAVVVGLMVNNILPARLGEIARAVFLGTKADLSKAYLLGTVMLDRLMDLAVLITLALLLLASVSVLPGLSLAVIIVGGVLLGGGVTLIALLRWGGGGIKRFLNFIQARLSTRVQRWFAGVWSQLQLSLATPRSWRKWVALVGLSLGVWFFMGISLLFALQAFAISLPFRGVGILLVVLNLGGLIPSSPGYIGTYHWLAVTTLVAFGIDRDTALSFALVNHALWYVPQVFVGLVILFRANLTVWALARRAKT